MDSHSRPRWILQEFARLSSAWLELQHRVWELDPSISLDALVQAVRRLMQSGAVRRVEVDGAAIYRFPPLAGDESAAATGRSFNWYRPPIPVAG